MENRVGQSQDKIGIAILQKDSQGRRLLCTRESCRQIWQFLFPFFDLIGLILELADPSRAGLIVPSENEENEDLLMLLMPMMLND